MLRAWRLDSDDAEALARAWADPLIQRFTTVPEDRSLDSARRWIEDEPHRAAAVDLVIEIDGLPAGEVGATQIDRERGTAIVSWWLLPEARGQGAATRAVETFSGWLLGPQRLIRLAAVIGPGNDPSTAVAERCGFRRGAVTAGGEVVFERRVDSARVRFRP